jgi:hypothetical protein
MFPTKACAVGSPRSAKGRKSRQADVASDWLYAATPSAKSPAIAAGPNLSKTTRTPATNQATVEPGLLVIRVGIGCARQHHGVRKPGGVPPDRFIAIRQIETVSPERGDFMVQMRGLKFRPVVDKMLHKVRSGVSSRP